MTAPMVLVELVMMRSMCASRAANAAIVIASSIIFAGSWFGIREQVAVDDGQFLRSMSPHRAGAVLTCGRLRAQDDEIRQLCQNIIRGQQAEIAEMKAIMARLK